MAEEIESQSRMRKLNWEKSEERKRERQSERGRLEGTKTSQRQFIFPCLTTDSSHSSTFETDYISHTFPLQSRRNHPELMYRM